ncbi:hypothetical protein BT93_H2626 [Corymbia citriodora subsp. variegata]|nr:hypothetical protein BT93_H2626 [Corymbia citriodora subsp. variegata]
MEKLLDVDSNDNVRFLIIHGIGGTGKSTLAGVIFNRFQSKFGCSSFLDDVPHQGLLDVQKKLLYDTLGSTSTAGINDTNEGIDCIRRGLSNKKVMVVVDNVDERRQLKNLVGGCDWFGPGSRIIITVRDKSTILDNNNQTPPSNYLAYPMKEMPIVQAIQLFSKHAFRSDTPPVDYYNFSKRVISSIGRLPLTLEVMGSLFASKDRSKWDETLEDLKKVPHRDIQKTLMLSINKLDNIEKAIFLDIACFCIGEDKTYVEYMWHSNEYSPRIAIDVLLLMSLIKINEENILWMHDEVRDLGRYIVRKENFQDVGMRCWVQITEDTLDILRRNKMAEKLKVLNLTDCNNLTKTPDLSKFSKLEKLILDRCSNLSTIDSSINKVKLLNTLNINGCISLQELPEEIGSLECLSEFIMSYTNHHIKLPETLGNLKSLMNLEVESNINQLPHSIGRLKNLKYLLLSECEKLLELPNSIGELESLVKLDLNNLEISVLPDSIRRLKNLKHFHLYECWKLLELPDSIGELESLVELRLDFLKISVLPDSIRRLKNLKDLVLSQCELLELRESIGELESLVNLYLSVLEISILPDSIGRLKNLKHLQLFGCEKLYELPNSIGELESLAKLDLRLSGISVLPGSIGGLKNLKHLLLSKCTMLLELPDSTGELESLVELDLKFSSIFILPSSIGRLKNLKHLLLSTYEQLLELPNSIGELESLVKLDLNVHLDLHFSEISVLPSSIGRLKNLKHLLLFKCEKLLELPNSIGELESLVKPDLSFSGISVLPDSIGRLKSLKHLLLSNCKKLLELPDSIGELESLVELDLKLSPVCIICDSTGRSKNFTHLSFSESQYQLELVRFGEPKSLVKLDIKGFEISTLLKSIRRIKHELLDSIVQIELLVELDLKFSGISLLSDSIGNLKRLKVLKVAYTKIRTIPYALGGVEMLEELDALFCRHLLEEIPWEMWSLTRLKILNLYESPISTIPRKISGFSSLQTLKIASHRLLPLPELPSCLKCLVVEAAQFPILPDLSSLVHLHHLEVRTKQSMTFWTSNEVTSPWKDVHSLNRLPLSLSTLKLHSIPQLPDLYNFQSLLVLSISGCLTPRIPDLSCLKKLQELRLGDFPELVEILGLGELESLTFLHITMCKVIKLLPNLSKLKTVEGLKELNSLTKVEIKYCMSLEKLPDLPAFIELKTDCTVLEAAGHNIRSIARRHLLVSVV